MRPADCEQDRTLHRVCPTEHDAGLQAGGRTAQGCQLAGQLQGCVDDGFVGRRLTQQLGGQPIAQQAGGSGGLVMLQLADGRQDAAPISTAMALAAYRTRASRRTA